MRNKELIAQFDKLLATDVPIIKVTDLHHVLDYYDSFSKFEWHAKKDDSRLLRSLVNGEGWLIVTSRKKIYMKMRHRMEFHKFSKDQTTKKFEIPRLCLDAPLGTSLFQTPSEFNYSLEHKVKIEDKYKGMIQKLQNKHNTKPPTPCSSHDKICSKILIAEPKPKKDTYFCCICNDDYNSYISHITTNQHKLSSYAENLAQYYEKIDHINTQLNSNNSALNLWSPAKEKFSISDPNQSEPKTPDKVEKRIDRLSEMIDNILYNDKPKKTSKSLNQLTNFDFYRKSIYFGMVLCHFMSLKEDMSILV